MSHSPNRAKTPSLDVAFSLSKDRISIQLDQVNALDTKANFVLTSASILLGTAVAFTAAVSLSPHTASPLQVMQAVFVSLAFVAYLCVVVSFYEGFKVRSYKLVPDPRALLDHYLSETEEVTKEDALRAMADAFDENVKGVTRKASATTWALRALTAESILLALALVTQAFS